MQFIIHHKTQGLIEKNINITTVTLCNDPDDPEGKRLYLFHCSRCGRGIIQHTGKVCSILAGNIPISLPIISKCSDCHKMYRFVTII